MSRIVQMPTQLGIDVSYVKETSRHGFRVTRKRLSLFHLIGGPEHFKEALKSSCASERTTLHSRCDSILNWQPPLHLGLHYRISLVLHSART